MLLEGLRSRGAHSTSPSSDGHSSSIITAYFENIDSTEIIQGIRNKHVYVSSRAGAIRFSPHLYNTAADIEQALAHIGGCVNR
jgi:selenocysteine lyase/cysteine desulfurase